MKIFNLILTFILYSVCPVYALTGLATTTKTLTTANVAERLSPVVTKIVAQELTIQNTSAVDVFIGDVTVTISGSNVGLKIISGTSVSLDQSLKRGTGEPWDTSQIYAVSGTDNITFTIAFSKKLP